LIKTWNLIDGHPAYSNPCPVIEKLQKIYIKLEEHITV
jgi:hypothetical protein